MLKIMLPIKPEYAEKILTGEKIYEFRKTMPKRRRLKRLLIYETAPVCKIVGEAEILSIAHPIAKTITEQGFYLLRSGISREKLAEYYRGYLFACVFVLQKARRFENPKDLADYGLTHAPQNFVYINDKEELEK